MKNYCDLYYNHSRCCVRCNVNILIRVQFQPIYINLYNNIYKYKHINILINEIIVIIVITKIYIT